MTQLTRKKQVPALLVPRRPNRKIYPYLSDTRRAIEKAGGPAVVAREFNIRTQAVWGWVTYGRIPDNRVLTVEKMSGVSRHKLRPDVFGKR